MAAAQYSGDNTHHAKVKIMAEIVNEQQTRSLARSVRWLLRIGLAWAVILLVLMATTDDPTPEDHTLALSITLSGIYTVLLRFTRQWWLTRLAPPDRTRRDIVRRAMLLGIVNAAVIEALFLVIEHILGAEGIAAHPNLLVDWLITMPWYAGVIVLFVRVQDRRRFAPAMVLLLGGLYEIGGDGIAGGLFSGALFSPTYFPLLFAVMLWLFIPVYSSMVLPPAWVIATLPDDPPDGVREPSPPGAPWRDALRPLLWLIPFIVYLAVLLVVIGAVTSGR